MIQAYLDLLAFVVSDPFVKIGVENIKILWQMFIQ